MSDSGRIYILKLLPIHSLLTHYVDHQEARAAIHNRLLYSVISQDSGSQFMNMNPVCQHICIQPKSSRNGYVTTISRSIKNLFSDIPYHIKSHVNEGECTAEALRQAPSISPLGSMESRHSQRLDSRATVHPFFCLLVL